MAYIDDEMEYEKNLIMPSAYYHQWEMVIPEEQEVEFEGLGRIKIGKFVRRAMGRKVVKFIKPIGKKVTKFVKPLVKSLGTFVKAYPIGVAALGIGAVAAGVMIAKKRKKKKKKARMEAKRKLALLKSQVPPESSVPQYIEPPIIPPTSPQPITGSMIQQPTYTTYQKEIQSEKEVSLVQPVTVPETLAPTISQDSEQFNPTVQPGQPINQPIFAPIPTPKPVEAGVFEKLPMNYIMLGGMGLIVLYFVLSKK